MRASVVCAGQVSDNPKHKQSEVKGCLLVNRLPTAVVNFCERRLFWCPSLVEHKNFHHVTRKGDDRLVRKH